MALEDLITQATSTLAAQLHEEFARQIADAKASARVDVDREIAEAVEHAREEADAAALAKIEAARAEIEQAADARLEALRAELGRAAVARAESARADAEEAAAARIDAARAEAEDAALARIEAMRTELEGAQARADAARAEAEEAAVARIDAARAEAEEAAVARIEAVRTEAEAAAAARIEALRTELEDRAAARAEAARADAERSAEGEIARVRAEAEAAAELVRARAAVESERQVDAAVADVAVGERQSQMLGVERLLAVVRALDTAGSLTDVLGELIDGAAREAPRVALLTLHGDRVKGWRFRGFSEDPGPVDLNVLDAGVVGRAIRSGDVVLAEPSSPGQDEPAGPAFVTLPPDRSGLAVPLMIGSVPVAVLYADDVSEVEQAKPAPWPEAIELLARHAAARLENLTVVRTAQALGVAPRTHGRAAAGPSTTDDIDGEEGARRYARLLVAEITLYNEPAVRVGRQKHDLLARLQAEISRARRLYDDRVPEDLRARHNYFDDELLQTLAGGDALLLGRASDAMA